MQNVKPGHEKPVVCLDAGHFGKYNPSPVVPEFYEAEINWRLMQLLKTELEKYCISVRTTRTNQGYDLGLVARGRASKDCDLFLSLHVNAAEDEQVNYVLAINMGKNGVTDFQSEAVAKLLAQGVGEVMGAADRRIWSRVTESDNDGDGFPDEYYGVLRGAQRVGTPGVILEHGFYTNPVQAKWLMQEENLQRLAKKEALILALWFDVVEQGKPYVLSLRSIPRGSRGPKVAAAQALLIANGYSCGKAGMDGSYGGDTEKAVRKYQTDHKLQVDGIIGGQTMSSLLGYW